ncbi:MAG: 16S rRNA (guanine(527)-N(7))-methyltransferase RsmG [Oscillospiraceae bacterium]|nr:16S rRNA (guanine(527)-N(7))-methyltransferase RsmG [Oscillospiraceae bacterium]
MAERILESTLSRGLAELGIAADSAALARFRAYYELLTERNAVMNLTAISGEEETARLHFLDSAAPLLFAPLSGNSVIDVGTGAGFPGLPLKILCPDMRLTLLDSLAKRVDFLAETAQALELEGVECVHARAEECGQRREAFDFAVSRAVARLNVLCELCLPYVKTGGAFLALKGPDPAEELAEAECAAQLLGGKIERAAAYALPFTGEGRTVVIIRKLTPTPPK